jgi:glucosamine-6-phosphate deaminase
MNILILDTYEELSIRGADFFVQTLTSNPAAVLGLATGSTPIGVYQQLIAQHQAGQLDFSAVTTFNLDEYIGLHRDHPQSYYSFMQQELFQHINVSPDRIHVPTGVEDNFGGYCQWYEDAIIAAGGIDLQILGIGTDGHIAFNEPGTALGSRTHLTDLDQQTISDNARFFGSADDVPRRAITMGVATIMDAREIILLATGKNKAAAIQAAIESPVGSECTASALQNHPHVTFLLDPAAASLLTNQ